MQFYKDQVVCNKKKSFLFKVMFGKNLFFSQIKTVKKDLGVFVKHTLKQKKKTFRKNNASQTGS